MTSKIFIALFLILTSTMIYFNSQDEICGVKARVHSNLGKAYYKVGKFAEAKEQCQLAILKQPTVSHQYINLGAVMDAFGEYGEAIEVYNKALQIDPTNHIAHFNKGRAYFKRGQLDDAIKEFREVIRLSDYDLVTESYNNIGYMKAIQQRYGEALSAFENAIRVEPNNIEAVKNYQMFMRFHKEV